MCQKATDVTVEKYSSHTSVNFVLKKILTL